MLFNMGFSLMFTIIPILFVVVFCYVLFSGVSQWNRNNKQPVLSVAATLVGKRVNRSSHNHDNHVHRNTTYYVTFEVESGDRMEFHINGKEYGLLVEGDIGKLTFQGTRYMGFERS